MSCVFWNPQIYLHVVVSKVSIQICSFCSFDWFSDLEFSHPMMVSDLDLEFFSAIVWNLLLDWELSHH